MNLSTVTNTGRTVEARQYGNRVRIVVYGARWSDVSIEWVHPNAAQARFDKLVQMNSRKPQEVMTVKFVEKKTKYEDLMRDDWEEWQGGNFDLLDFY